MTFALTAARSLHLRPGRWTPKELSLLSLWLDADDPSSLTWSSVSRPAVSAWNDKSGNGRHLTQSVEGNQPTVATAAQNGRNVVRFDGVNSFLSGGGSMLNLETADLSIVGAFRNETNSYVLSKTSGGVNATAEWTFSSSGCQAFMTGAVVNTLQASNTNATKIQSWVLDRSDSSTLWTNGAQADQDLGPTNFSDANAINAALLLMGSSSNTSASRLQGDVYEIVLSRTALSVTDRQSVEGYLAHKWGLAANLPSDHPHKSGPPMNGSVAWTPGDLAVLDLWLDADDGSTITQSTLTNETAVSQWRDKSVNAFHVSQPTVASRPAYVASARNGRAAMRHNGASSYLLGGDVLDVGTGGLSLAAVSFPIAGAERSILNKWRSDASIAGAWSFYATGGSFRSSTSNRGVGAASTLGQLVLSCVVIDRSAGSTPYTNGTAETTLTDGYPDTTHYNAARIITVGALSTSTTAASNFLNGDICEIVVSLGTWTTQERQLVEGYLAHKWGLSGSLPSGHPYKNAAP